MVREILPDGLVALVNNLLPVVLADLVLDLLVLDGGLHVEAVRLQIVLCRDPLLLLVVVVLELLRVIDHPLDLLLGEPALIIGDGDLVLLPGRLVARGDIEDAVGVDIKRNLFI